MNAKNENCNASTSAAPVAQSTAGAANFSDRQVENIMGLAHQWAQATYKKALGMSFDDIDAIKACMRKILAAPALNPSDAPAGGYDKAREMETLANVALAEIESMERAAIAADRAQQAGAAAPTWQERMSAQGWKPDHHAYHAAKSSYMEAEIADLRAQLARQGQGALDAFEKFIQVDPGRGLASDYFLRKLKSIDESNPEFLDKGVDHDWQIFRTGYLASPAQASAAPAELIELLKAIRPSYGAVGSRDIDVAAQQKRIDRAIELLSASAAPGQARAAAPEAVQIVREAVRQLAESPRRTGSSYVEGMVVGANMCLVRLERMLAASPEPATAATGANSFPIATDDAWGVRKDGQWVQEKGAPLPFMRNTKEDAQRLCVDFTYEPRRLRTLVYDVTEREPAAQPVEPPADDARDAARLDFMVQHEAWVAHGKDGESCRVFHRTDDGDAVPMLGWGARHWRHDPREAIDAAMQASKSVTDGDAKE